MSRIQDNYTLLNVRVICSHYQHNTAVGWQFALPRMYGLVYDDLRFELIFVYTALVTADIYHL